VILFFAFVSAFDHLFDFFCSFLSFFPFLFCLATVCVINALIKGETEDMCVSEDWWMVAP
jgi:hypothetical protein